MNSKKKETVDVNFEADVYEGIQEMAKETGVTFDEYVEQVLAEHLRDKGYPLEKAGNR